MSAFREAASARTAQGWRSEGRPDEPCKFCKQEGGVFYTTIHGRTTADCSVCGKAWPVVTES